MIFACLNYINKKIKEVKISETEAWKGKLIPTGLTLQEFMKDVDFPEYYDRNDQEDIEECFNDKFYRDAVLIEGFVYEVEKKSFEYEDIFEANILENGEIQFIVSYYNGGCSFNDAIKEAVESIKTKTTLKNTNANIGICLEFKKCARFLLRNGWISCGKGLYANDPFLSVELYKDEIVLIDGNGDFLNLPMNYYALIGALFDLRQININYKSGEV